MHRSLHKFSYGVCLKLPIKRVTVILRVIDNKCLSTCALTVLIKALLVMQKTKKSVIKMEISVMVLVETDEAGLLLKKTVFCTVPLVCRLNPGPK